MAILEKNQAHIHARCGSRRQKIYWGTPKLREKSEEKERSKWDIQTASSYPTNIFPLHRETTTSDSDKKFIDFTAQFKSQFSAKADYVGGLKEHQALKLIEPPLNLILGLDPEKMSLEVTYDGSIFYRFIKDEITFYLQQYIKTENDEDEAFLNIFFMDGSTQNYSGDLPLVLNQISELQPHDGFMA